MATPASPHDTELASEVTIRLPGSRPDRDGETVVRPALAILFRAAVGPSADRYVRRFLAFERTGRGRIGWHWGAFLLPPVWAFYRRLWFTGVLYALLPVAGALAFGMLAWRLPLVDSTWIASALLAVWVLPGVVPALIADTLLYHRVRRHVRQAEAATRGAAAAMQRLSASRPTSVLAAVCLGGGAMLVAASWLLPHFAEDFAERDLRERLVETLAAARGLQDDIAATWPTARLVPMQLRHPAVAAQAQAAAIEDVDVNPFSGRVRLALGPALRQLWGKTILLAPSRDSTGEMRWLCVPIDIPARYLPPECRP
jgi:hypothetical protein